jgi:hypothetical protein
MQRFEEWLRRHGWRAVLVLVAIAALIRAWMTWQNLGSGGP